MLQNTDFRGVLRSSLSADLYATIVLIFEATLEIGRRLLRLVCQQVEGAIQSQSPEDDPADVPTLAHSNIHLRLHLSIAQKTIDRLTNLYYRLRQEAVAEGSRNAQIHLTEEEERQTPFAKWKDVVTVKSHE